MYLNLLFILFLFSPEYFLNCFATLTPSFRKYLINYGGVKLDKLLSREDLGPGGSYGGGNHKAGEKTRLKPVIMVHGTSVAADINEPLRQYFLKNGYGDEEFYGTTYGDNGTTNLFFVKMECEFVKIVRLMIITASNYTSNKVNVIAISMGNPISRKAILGGKCVDTGEDLGLPLTDIINTFVGVAGPNWGSFLCVIPVFACNKLNGLHCKSAYLKDINSKQRYEGSLIFTIFSPTDDMVGYKVCGRISSSIEGEDDNFEFEGLNHSAVIESTGHLQYNLVTYGKALN